MVCASMRQKHEDDKRSDPLSMRLPKWLRTGLKELADAENRSVTNYIETVLRQHVTREGKRK